MWFECRVCLTKYQAHDNSNTVQPGFCVEHRRREQPLHPFPPIPSRKLAREPVKLHFECKDLGYPSPPKRRDLLETMSFT